MVRKEATGISVKNNLGGDKMKKLVLIGAGGYCSGIIDSLQDSNEYEIVGITDPTVKGEVYGIPIIGTDSILEELYQSGITCAHISVGSVGDPSLRVNLIIMARKIGFELISIIDGTAVIAKHVLFGAMIYIGKNAVINSNARIGDYCIINTACVVEHGCEIGDFVHIAPASVLAGDVKIGNNSHVGLNTTILQGVEIGHHVIIGAGSVVIRNVCDNQTVVGLVKEKYNENKND